MVVVVLDGGGPSQGFSNTYDIIRRKSELHLPAWCIDEHKAPIGKDGISLILKCMKIHSDVPIVQETACGALSNLSLNGDNKIKIGKEGGISLIIEAMRNHSQVLDVLVQACSALSNLSFNSMSVHQCAFGPVSCTTGRLPSDSHGQLVLRDHTYTHARAHTHTHLATARSLFVHLVPELTSLQPRVVVKYTNSNPTIRAADI